MPSENPMRLRCQKCGLIVEPGAKLIGIECDGCGASNWATHRDTPVCDFCCIEGEPVVAQFPAQDFRVPLPTDRVKANSRGYWAACENCRHDIEAGDREALAERSTESYIRKSRQRIPRKLLIVEIRKLHDQFWSHRDGPGIPIKQEDA